MLRGSKAITNDGKNKNNNKNDAHNDDDNDNNKDEKKYDKGRDKQSQVLYGQLLPTFFASWCQQFLAYLPA